MNNTVLNEDLRVFVEVARRSSFSAAAQAHGVSPAYVSKRIRILERALGVQLFQRSTRRVVITEDGERAYARAQRILEDIDQLYDDVAATRRSPRGVLRLCSSFGFGRNVVAPAISQLVRAHPGLQVRFEVFDRLVDVAAEGFDLDIRVGDDIAPQWVARRLAPNHRILCAAPAYLQKHGRPRTLADLANHSCLVIKERDHPFGIWKLANGVVQETVKVTGPLSSNNGEIVLRWAEDGQGIVLRSWWDVAALVQSGKLEQVLPDYRQQANIYAVYAPGATRSAKTRVCVEFLEAYFAKAQ